MILPQKLLKYREYSRHFWVDSFQNKCQKTQRNLINSVLRNDFLDSLSLPDVIRRAFLFYKFHFNVHKKPNNTIQLDIADLPAGHYHIRMYNAETCRCSLL